MRYQQRQSTTTEQAVDPLWQPQQAKTAKAAKGKLENATPPPLATDVYATVDERVEGVVGLVFSRWPTVSAQGRLRFPLDRFESWHDEGPLAKRIDALRTRSKQLNRPLRIGDTFWIRGYSEDPKRWRDLRDVTQGARMATRLAVAAAIGEYAPAPKATRVKDAAREPASGPRFGGPDAVARPIV